MKLITTFLTFPSTSTKGIKMKLSEYCRKNDLCYTSMYRTLAEIGSNAMDTSSFDKAKYLNKLRRKIQRGKLEWVINGMSLNKYCKVNGIRYATVYSRMKKGLTLQEALKGRKK